MRTRELPNIAQAVDEAIARLPFCCMRDGYTYLVAGAGRIKVGKSKNVRSRIASMQIGSPVPLRLLELVRGDCEWVLHAHLHRFAVHGEWFSHEALGALLPFRIPEVCLHCAMAMRLDKLNATPNPSVTACYQRMMREALSVGMCPTTVRQLSVEARVTREAIA